MKYEPQTEITIDASPEVDWAGTKLVNRMVAPGGRAMIDGSTRDGFIAFNDAIKARAEAT